MQVRQSCAAASRMWTWSVPPVSRRAASSRPSSSYAPAWSKASTSAQAAVDEELTACDPPSVTGRASTAYPSTELSSYRPDKDDTTTGRARQRHERAPAPIAGLPIRCGHLQCGSRQVQTDVAGARRRAQQGQGMSLNPSCCRLYNGSRAVDRWKITRSGGVTSYELRATSSPPEPVALHS